MRARPRGSVVLLIGVLGCLISAVIGTYEPAAYGAHYSYAPAPAHHHQSYGGGHNAGSYYHYHVPLVGQQQHYQPQHHQSDHHHLLYLLLPLLLLLALPLLFLPLLPLLLLPIGLSLLALLAPLLMMGGMAMMMMMMMMAGGGMMMPMMRRGIDGQNDMRTLGELIFGDVATIASKYARSLDLDKCPERVACEIGSAAFPQNASRTATAKAFMNYIVDNAIPKGKARKLIRQYREALWTGSKTSSCVIYHCQPSLRMNFEEESTPKSKHSTRIKGTAHFQATNGTSSSTNSSNTTASSSNYYADYYNQYQQQLNANYNATQQESNLAAAEAYYKYYAQNPSENEVSGSDSASGSFYSAFATPVVRS